MKLSTHLAILQQSEYEWNRYIEWYKRHKDDEKEVQPKKKTPKYIGLLFMSTIFSVAMKQTDAVKLALHTLSFPEIMVKNSIIFSAKIKLRYLQIRGLTIVAIAGSYGKTSTKQIMHQLLSSHVSTLSTPESINTKLGIAFIIHKKLHLTHKLFIVELGAYVPGDIADLVRFTNPKFGVLTPIGTEHLERFGNMDNVINTEAEIITTKSMKVLSADGNMLLLPEHVKTKQVSFYGFFPNSYYDVSNIKVSRAGTECSLAIGDTRRDVFIPLYGKHNILNILPSFWIGNELGISSETILSEVMNLKPVAHRMDPTLTENNILIIDNGYNTNPDSSKESLAVLSQMSAKKKVIVTPGFVEMGKKQDLFNKDFGKRMAQVFDIICVLGSTNKEALLLGLSESKFPKKNTLTATDEKEAMSILSKHLEPNSVILFEGGTPEIYQ